MYVYIYNNTDKLWPSDKYGFKFAYAIRLRNSWIIKKPEQGWMKRLSGWSPSDEIRWSKYCDVVVRYIMYTVSYN